MQNRALIAKSDHSVTAARLFFLENEEVETSAWYGPTVLSFPQPDGRGPLPFTKPWAATPSEVSPLHS